MPYPIVIKKLNGYKESIIVDEKSTMEQVKISLLERPSFAQSNVKSLRFVHKGKPIQDSLVSLSLSLFI